MNPSVSLLPQELLMQRHQLAKKPDPISLIGQYVYLKPLVIEKDGDRLFEMSNGSSIQMDTRSIEAYDANEMIWRYMFEGPFENASAFKDHLQPYVDAVDGLCLCAFDPVSDRQIGVANLMNHAPAHLKIELGGIWYSPIVQRTLVNTEATYLMLKALFERGYRRIEWKCDARNERSRRAALRMGFEFEGIQENHMIMKDQSRDTAWFRMLDSEWLEMKQRLEKSLYNAS